MVRKMLYFACEYFLKEKKKSINLISILTVSLLILGMMLTMYNDVNLTPPIDFDTIKAFSLSLLRLSVFMLMLAVFVYLIIYSSSYYQKTNSQILGLLKIFGLPDSQIFYFFFIQMLFMTLIAYGLYAMFSLVTIPVLMKVIYAFLNQNTGFINMGNVNFEVIVFLLLIMLFILLSQLSYIIRMPVSDLMKNDEIVSFQLKKTSFFQRTKYLGLFIFGFVVMIIEKFDIQVIIPLLLCVFGIKGMIQYVIPFWIEKFLKHREISGQMLVVIKNCLLLLQQMNVIVILNVVVCLTHMILIFYYRHQQGLFIEYIIIYILGSLVLNAVIYQRLQIRRLNQKQLYQKLFILGYDCYEIKKYCCLEISLFYMVQLIIQSLYLGTMSWVIMVLQKGSLWYICLFLYDILIFLIFYLLAYYMERVNVKLWKKL